MQFQIVVCQNVSTRQGMVQGVLAHEMIHMFDYCRNQLDFKNMEHLACTEIRAANLTHCSFASAWSQGDASWGKIKKAHQVNNLLIISYKNMKCLCKLKTNSQYKLSLSGLCENQGSIFCAGCQTNWHERGCGHNRKSIP